MAGPSPLNQMQKERTLALIEENSSRKMGEGCIKEKSNRERKRREASGVRREGDWEGQSKVKRKIRPVFAR